MSRSSKRIWSPNVSLEDGVSLVLNFLIRSREKNILTNTAPKVYKVFKKEGLIPVRDFQEVSSFLKFSKNDTPETDRAKNSIVRLLSVCLKSHFHWFPKGIIKNEPYVFTIPDLLNPDVLQYGLIYYVEENGKYYSLLVADWDIEHTVVKKNKVYSADMTTIILSQNSYKWLNLKHWRELKTNISMENNLLNIKNLEGKKEIFNSVHLIKEKDNFPFGNLLNYPIDVKDDVSYAGGEWANGIKSWFIPFGLDCELVKEYIDFIIKEKNKIAGK